MYPRDGAWSGRLFAHRGWDVGYAGRRVSDTSLSPEEFGRAFRRFLDRLPTMAADERGLAARLREHFNAEPPYTSVDGAPASPATRGPSGGRRRTC